MPSWRARGRACARLSAVNIHNDDAGDLEIGSPGGSAAGGGTRASANTSGSDFTMGVSAPVKLRTVDPHRTKKTCFFCRTGFPKNEFPEGRSSRLT